MLKRVAKKRTRGDAGLRIGIVASRYNARYVNGMLKAAKVTLGEAGVSGAGLSVARVPGAFEIPVVIARWAAGGDDRPFDALIGLGVILQGETSHAEHIGSAVTQAFASIQVQYCVPVIHEVLVFTTVEQAKQRCLSAEHNRGREAANTALEMAGLMRRL